MVIICCQDQISFVTYFEYIPLDVPYHWMYFGCTFLKLGIFHMSSISRECVRPHVIVFATRQWDWESDSSRQEHAIFSHIYILDGACLPSDNVWSPQLVHLMFRTKFWQGSSWSDVQVVLCKTFHRWLEQRSAATWLHLCFYRCQLPIHTGRRMEVSSNCQTQHYR